MRAKDPSSKPCERNALRELSARLGGNPLLVQASSGNTSLKIDDVLWIKASGKWLIQAEREDFLISVPLAEAKRRLRENTTITESRTKLPGGVCASIETAMHVVLPHKVVVHVHSINAIAWAVREDGPRQLSTRLSGLAWQWIPYTPSGASLASEIKNALLCSPQTNVFVLGNHGLVVCGNSCRSAEQLLAEVEQRLAIEPRPTPEPNYALLQQALTGAGWFLPACAEVHALATDPISRRILSGGVLYPCQALFLPDMLPVRACAPFPELCRQRGHAPPPVLLVEEQGVLVSEGMTRAEWEMLVGLANVVQRIDGSTSLRYLTTAEITDVLNGEGDQYRRSANTNDYSKISDHSSRGTHSSVQTAESCALAK